MADRGRVHYVEAAGVGKSNYPARPYFANLIDIILTNLNERDSINRVAGNPDHHTNRDNQLGGINDQQDQANLNNARARIVTSNAPLYADDVNQIISNTELLASTVAAPGTGTKLIDCSFPVNTQIVPTSFDPTDTGGAVNDVTVTTKKVSGTDADTDTAIDLYGFSSLSKAQLKTLTKIESDPFGSVLPIDIIVIDNTKANIKAAFQEVATLKDSVVSTLYVVLDMKLDALPASLVDVEVVIGSVTSTIKKTDIKSLDADTCYIAVSNKFSEFVQADGTKVKFQIVTDIDDEAKLAKDARICSLLYDPANPDTECANRVKQFGYNQIHENEPGYVYICSNTKRRVTYTITAGTPVSIQRVGVGEVVYAATFTEIANYLRSVSNGLNGYASWWDGNGWCLLSCQVACQAACELACQSCFYSTCHDQNCGLS